MKKYFSFPILLLLFFSTQQMYASINPTYVEPISINDGIWNVLSRVGIVVDEILGATGCHYFVHQIDLPLTINAPGNYCLVHSVTFSGTAVTINSSGVNFDMRNYMMDAEFNTNSIAFLVNSGSNISIKNGSIHNVTGGAIIGGNTLLENIVISDVNIMQSLVGIVFDNGMNVESMLIKDCYFSNGDGITIQGSGITVSGCELDDFYTGTGVAAITIQGVSDAQLARHIIVEDCIITGSLIGDSQGISIQLAENALVDNCKVSGPVFSSSIGFGNVSSLRCSNCSVIGGSISIGNSTPFTTPTNSAVIENCMILSYGGIAIGVIAGPLPVLISNVAIKDCVISGAGTGVYLLAGFGGLEGDLKNILIQGCDFLDNSVGIFLYPPAPTATLNNVIIKDCLFAGGSGSSIGVQMAGGSSEQANNVVVTRCVTQNIHEGFHDGTIGSSRIFDHCIMQDAVTGLSSTSSYCQVINCCAETMQQNGFVGSSNFLALANSSQNALLGGFVGVPASLVKSGAVAASNAEYWNNVAF
jgi:hypothetical protein